MFHQNQFNPYKVYEDGAVSAVNDDSSVDLVVGAREHPYHKIHPSRKNENMVPGSRARAIAIQGSSNIWTIQPSEDTNPKDGGTSSSASEGPVTPVPVIPGLWTNERGLWWKAGHAQSSQALLTYDTADTERTEVDFANTVYQTGHVDLHFPHFINEAKAWTIFQDGVEWGSKTVPGPYSIFKYTTGPNPNWHAVWSIQHDYPDTTVWTVSYFEPNATSSIELLKIRDFEGDGGTVHSSTLHFEGRVMFPGQPNSIVGFLTAHYVDTPGGAVAEHQLREEITFVATLGEVAMPTHQMEGRFATLQNAATSLVKMYSPELIPDFSNYQLVPDFSGGTEFMFKLLYVPGGANPDFTGDLEFRYIYRPTASLTAYAEDFTGDGATTTFVLDSGQGSSNSNVPFFPKTATAIVIHDPGGDIDATLTATLGYDSVTDHGYFILDPPPGVGVVINFEAQCWVTAEMHEQRTRAPSNTEYTMLLAEDGLVKVLSLYAQSSFDSNFYNTNWDPNWLRAVGDQIQFRYWFYAGDILKMTYKYLGTAPSGTYDISEMRIYEMTMLTYEMTILKTPLPSGISAHGIDPEDGSPVMGTVTGDAQSFLFYDNSAACYTLVSPAGLIWRDRLLLTDPVPTGPGAHYTLAAWPAELNTTDTSILDHQGFSDSQPLSRRAQPWLGVSVAGSYALQGSWRVVGGYQKDADAFLRLWSRSVKKALWSSFAQLSVTKLCGTPAPPTTFPLMVCAAGSTNGLDGIANSGWPCTRNQRAWLVAAQWIVYNFEQQATHPELFDPNTYGWDHAGMTVNAVSCRTGQVLASLTLQCDKALVYNDFTYPSEKVEAHSPADLTAFDAQMVDKYVTVNLVYWLPLPSGPGGGQHQWISDEGWGLVQPYGYRNCFYLITGIRDRIAPVLNYPGIPTPAEAPANQWIRGSGGDIAGLTQNLLLDDQNNLYLLLNYPTWLRQHDEFGAPARSITRHCTTTVSYSTQRIYLINDVTGLQEVLSGNVYAMVNGVRYTGYISYGVNGPFAVKATFVDLTSGGLNAGDTVVVHYDVQGPNIPIMSTITDHLLGPTCFEVYTLTGWECQGQGSVGWLSCGYSADVMQQFQVINVTRMLKVHYDEVAKTFAETWNVDVSQYCQIPESIYDTGARDPRPSSGERQYLVAGGRIVAFVAVNQRVKPLDTTDLTTQHTLEIWENSSTLPVLRHSLALAFLPTGMTLDVDSNAREHLTVWDAGTGNPAVTTFHMQTTLTDAPDIHIMLPTGSPPLIPLVMDFGAIRVSDYYLWGDGSTFYLRLL